MAAPAHQQEPVRRSRALPSRPILIAGAGIGGLTAAIALARRGIPVVIAEKRTRLDEVGAGLQISPNAGAVLSGLGLDLPQSRVAVRPRELVIQRWTDRGVLGRMPFNAGLDDEAVPFRVFKRADLHQLLLDAARTIPGIRWIIGRGLSDVEETQRGIVATLSGENGQTETLEAMGLIGADGVWSRARQLTGDDREPSFTGWEAWRTLIPANAVPEACEPLVSLHLGNARHAVHYPVSAGREINLVVIRAAREARPGWSRDGRAEALTPTTATASPLLRHMIAAAPAWQAWSLFDREPTALAKGRIALLGDAAHPVLPFMAQGAALAIEDAAVLAHELAARLAQGGESAVPAAFAAYAAARRTRVARVQRTSRDNARAYHLGLPLSLARDMVLRRLGPSGMLKRHAWIYDWRAPV